jgi:acyl-ACP thioesterase
VINTNKRKPESLALPHEHFEKFSKNATKKSLSKIDIKEEIKILENYTVRLSDLDVVNHANNVKYLEWCLNHCDANQIMSNELKAFEMNFMRELALGDETVIGHHDDVFVITNNDKACFALQLEWN